MPVSLVGGLDLEVAVQTVEVVVSGEVLLRGRTHSFAAQVVTQDACATDNTELV